MCSFAGIESINDGSVSPAKDTIRSGKPAARMRWAVSIGYRPLPAIKAMGRWEKLSGRNFDREEGGLMAIDYSLYS